jgi:hypothetical protein
MDSANTRHSFLTKKFDRIQKIFKNHAKHLKAIHEQEYPRNSPLAAKACIHQFETCMGSQVEANAIGIQQIRPFPQVAWRLGLPRKHARSRTNRVGWRDRGAYLVGVHSLKSSKANYSLLRLSLSLTPVLFRSIPSS